MFDDTGVAEVAEESQMVRLRLSRVHINRKSEKRDTRAAVRRNSLSNLLFEYSNGNSERLLSNKIKGLKHESLILAQNERWRHA